MKFRTFLKDKIFFLICQTIVIFFVGFLFNIFKIGIFAIIFFCGTMILISFIPLVTEYFKRKKFYDSMYLAFEQLDKKQYLISVLEEPDFADAEIFYDVLKQSEKAMNDEIARYRMKNNEYREYIETWIHEVKIPISCINLMCENNKNEFSREISDEALKIDRYVEQALYYARSTNFEKDYSVRRLSLDREIKNVLKKYSKELISDRFEIKRENVDYTVFSDPKWIEFILGQIISNSIKYRKDKPLLSFSAEDKSGKVILSVTDNGIGIPQKDIGRVLEKGFTGENGRKFAKSTGIGLYLCSKLCKKMNHGFEISSVEGGKTTVKIIFPKDKLTMLED